MEIGSERREEGGGAGKWDREAEGQGEGAEPSLALALDIWVIARTCTWTCTARCIRRMVGEGQITQLK
jgi:hypothetical protein